MYIQVSGVGLWKIDPNEPFEVKDDYLGGIIIERKKLEGLVECRIVRTRTGLDFDLKNAIERANKARAEGREFRVKNYIKTQLNDRIQFNLPPRPPAPEVQAIIEEDGIDLAAEGINLIGAGFKVGGQMADMLKKVAEMEKTMQNIVEQNRLLSEQNELLKKKAMEPPRKN